MMPVEVLVRLPTASGVPLVYELNTILTYKMKSSVKTETPGIFDLPRLAFSYNKDLTLHAALNFE